MTRTLHQTRSDRVLGALAEPNRLEILQYLGLHPQATGVEITRSFGGRIAQPTVSNHLSRLMRAGLVVCQKRSVYSHFSLNPEGMRRVWSPILADEIPAAEPKTRRRRQA